MWNRYGLIAELAYRFEERQTQLTKNKLQMLIYLLQELFDIKADYNFEFYPYGLYCSQIDTDLAATEYLEAVKVNYATHAITTNAYNQEIRGSITEFITKNSANIDKAINIFGDCSTWELTIVGKVIYVLKKTENRTKDALLQEAKDKLRLLSQEEAITAARKLEKVKLI